MTRDRIWIWFADNGNIRKWSRESFAEGVEYASLSAPVPAPAWREALEGIRQRHENGLRLAKSRTGRDKANAALRVLDEIAALSASPAAPAAETMEPIGVVDRRRQKFASAKTHAIQTLAEKGWTLVYDRPALAPAQQEATGAVVDDGLSRAISFVTKRRDDYVDEHGSYDYSTGVTEFPGNGDETVCEWEEIIEGLKALRLEAKP